MPSGTFKEGSADDTLRFAANVNISGINGGGSTTFGQEPTSPTATAPSQ
ncbi:MAG: hypothetical protein U1E60_14915 [Reyranellaceae bacterium]